MLRITLIISMIIGLSATAAQGADVAHGRKTFKAVCGTCHSAVAGHNAIGPSLFGIVDRKSGSVEGFAYSKGNVASGVVWTKASLDDYISKPKNVVAQNKMTYAGIKDPAERADVIAYLSTLH